MSTTPYRQSTFSCHSLSSEGSLKTFGERDDGSVISIPLASPESSSSSSSAKISLSHPSPRRFHSSHLGRPPGTRQTNTSVKRPPSISHTSPVHKTTPMKELEKMMADVKKENFDLKLRIYHLEEIMVKDVDQQLLEENHRLALDLEDKIDQVEALEHALSPFLSVQTRSIGTQTNPVVEDSVETPKEGCLETYNAVLDAMNDLHITPQPNKPPLPAANNNLEGNDGRIRGWLNQLVENRMKQESSREFTL